MCFGRQVGISRLRFPAGPVVRRRLVGDRRWLKRWRVTACAERAKVHDDSPSGRIKRATHAHGLEHGHGPALRHGSQSLILTGEGFIPENGGGAGMRLRKP